MPRGDKTGPKGDGPMTGRGMGQCGGSHNNRRGFGRGFCRRGFMAGQDTQRHSQHEHPEELDEQTDN